MNLVYPFITFWIRVGAQVFFRAAVRGREHVPSSGPFVLAGNHVSNLDPPIIGAFLPRDVHFMAKAELFSKPILNWLLPRINAFPVDREGSAKAPLMDSLDLLRNGQCVGIFPEGGRNLEGDQGFRRGMAWLASMARVPVVPCAIAGSRDAVFFRTQIKVAYGSPMSLPVDRKATREELAKFTDAVMSEIYSLARDIGGNS